MADEATPISRKLELDTTEFKTGISSINRDIRLLESAFKSSAAGLQDWSKDATGLETRIKTLNAQIEDQRFKVQLLAKEHERVALAEGADSKAAQELQIKLNQATGTLNRMQLELGQDELALEGLARTSEDASVAVGVDLTVAATAGKAALAGLGLMAQGVVVELRTLVKVIQVEFAAAIGVLKVGAGAALGLAAAGGIAAVVLGALGLKAATSADQLGELADKTGFSTTRLQELDFAGKVIGTDLDTITGANARMIRSMASAKDGTGAQAAAFKALHVSVKDASGQLRDSNVVFGELLDALGKVENPTERDALAMSIFGKSAQELNPLIKAGSSGLEALTRRAHELGAVVSTETVEKLGSLRDRFDELVAGAKGLGTTLLGALAPLGSGVLDQAQEMLKQLVLAVRVGDQVDLSKLPAALGQMGTQIVVGLAQAMPQIAKTGVEIVQAFARSFSENLPVLLQAGRDILTVITDAIVQNLPAIAEAAPAILTEISDALLDVLPLLFGVGSQIILTLVTIIGQVLPAQLPKLKDTGLGIIKGLLTALQAAFPVIAEMVPTILQTLIDFLLQNTQMLIAVGVPMIVGLINAIIPALPMLVDAALQILEALADAIAGQLPVLMPVIVQVIIQIVEVLARNAPLLVKAAGELIRGLAEGFQLAAPTFYAMAPQLIATLISAFLSTIGELTVVGLTLLIEAIKGFVSGFPQYYKAVGELIAGIVRAWLSGMGQIVALGVQMVEGIWSGISEGWEQLKSDVGGLFSDLVVWLKGLLGIASPSKVFAEIGKNSMAGFTEGFLGGLDDMQRRAAAAMRDLGNGMGGNMTLGGSVSHNSEAFSFFAPVYVGGSTAPDGLAAKLKGRRY